MVAQCVNAIARAVLHIMVRLAERNDTVMALRCAAHAVGVSNDVMHIDRPRLANQTREFSHHCVVLLFPC